MDASIVRFKTRHLQTLLGVTFDDVTNWIRRNALNLPVEPAAYGKERGWTLEGALELALLSSLSQHGVPLSKAKALLAEHWHRVRACDRLVVWREDSGRFAASPVSAGAEAIDLPTAAAKALSHNSCSGTPRLLGIPPCSHQRRGRRRR
jgi:hypothetical protein